MKLALTVWEDRISPLCDAARWILVVEIKAGRIVDESRIPVQSGKPFVFVSSLAEREIDVLICGAVSESLSALLEQYGIKVVPFVSGQVSRVIRAYCNQQIERREFRMPGSRHGRKQQFRRRTGGRKGRPDNFFNLS